MYKFIFRATLTLGVIAACAPVVAASQAERPKTREVNITTDSEPGWLPSEELEAAALGTLRRFFTLQDSGDDQASYAMLTPGTRATIPFGQFKQRNLQFRKQAGALRERRVLKVTWTKNPANAPLPGTYAAIDESAIFEGVARQCGYIILFQAPDGGAFNVMRTENNFIDNASATEIERTQSKAALDRLWMQLSANCPNFQVAGA